MICKLCGAFFPLRLKIEGKWRGLQKRKYCLICSPFKTHNTRTLIEAVDTREPTEGNKICSRCHEERPLSFFYLRSAKTGKRRSECKECWAKIIGCVSTKRKEKIMKALGDKCVVCGYNKYRGALEFHHLDPSQKDPAVNVHNNGFEKALEEMKKCILVCANCHREIHAGLLNLNEG